MLPPLLPSTKFSLTAWATTLLLWAWCYRDDCVKVRLALMVAFIDTIIFAISVYWLPPWE